MDPVRIKRRKPINRKTKLNIVFDESARRDFLTGFRKRKLQRKKKAQDELKEKMKEERKRIKLEAQKSHTKLKLSYQPIPEVEELLKTTGKEYDMGDHSVSIVELSTDILQKKNNYIGENRVQYEDDKEDQTPGENEESTEEVTGMELKTRKELKKEKMKKATEEFKKSKAYKTQNKQQQIKQKRKAMQQKKIRMKMQEKNQRRNKKQKRKK